MQMLLASTEAEVSRVHNPQDTNTHRALVRLGSRGHGSAQELGHSLGFFKALLERILYVFVCVGLQLRQANDTPWNTLRMHDTHTHATTSYPWVRVRF